jgi:hypothetical protein
MKRTTSKDIAKRIAAALTNTNPERQRPVVIRGDGESAEVEDWGVAVTGSNGKAKAGKWAAVAGGSKSAVHSGGGVAMTWAGGSADTGDGSMAWANFGGRASGQLCSVAYAMPTGFARSNQQGIALTLGGLAESFGPGIAAAYSVCVPIQGGVVDWRGIAIAGPGGIAVAMMERSLVQAGIGGALVGMWNDKKGTSRVAVLTIAKEEDADQLFEFLGGEFRRVTGEALTKAKQDIEQWRKAGPKTAKPKTRRKNRKEA